MLGVIQPVRKKKRKKDWNCWKKGQEHHILSDEFACYIDDDFILMSE
jgi:hypothetical protein